MTALRDGLPASRTDSTPFLTARPWSTYSAATNDLQQLDSSPSTPEPDQQNARKARKPSPGLAARLKALGFGKDSTKAKPTSRSPSSDRVGRIPEDHIHKLDTIHRALSTKSTTIQRRGRAWSGASGQITPQASVANLNEITIDDSRLFEGETRRP
jgi:hypothetical protein